MKLHTSLHRKFRSAAIVLQLLLLSVIAPNLVAQTPLLDELQKLMKAAAAETLVGKTDILVAHAHPALIALVGGEEKAKSVVPKMMRAEFDSLEQAGFKITAFDIGKPETVRTEGDWTFVLVPTTLVAEGDKGKFTVKSHTLATHKRGSSAKWHLLRLGAPEARVRQMLPELPSDFALPAKQPPKFEKQ